MDPIPQPQNQNDDHTISRTPLPTNNQAQTSSPVANITTPSSTPVSPVVPASNPSHSPASVTATSASSTPVTNTPPSSPSSAQTTSPELDSLMTELNNYQLTTDDLQPGAQQETFVNSASTSPLSSLTPTDPTLSVASFSATPNPSDSGLASGPVQNQQSGPVLDSASPTVSASTPLGTEMTIDSDQAPQSGQPEVGDDENKEDQEDQPLVAAAPTPGSIGSAISYADFEKKQAEEAAKKVKNQNKSKIKLNRTTILIIVAAALFVIAGIILALMFLSEPQKKPTQATGKNQVEKASTKMLTCVRPLSTNESTEVGAAYGNFERQFTFENDNLSGISEQYVYQYNSENEAVTAKTSLDATIKSDGNTQVTTEINLNQLKKKSVIAGSNPDNYLKSLSEFSSITTYDLNSLMLAENQTGLSCSTIE